MFIDIFADYPEVYEASLKKHQQLDKHLRDVYVKSSGNFEVKNTEVFVMYLLLYCIFSHSHFR